MLELDDRVEAFGQVEGHPVLQVVRRHSGHGGAPSSVFFVMARP
jgi:hypothetical protein